MIKAGRLFEMLRRGLLPQFYPVRLMLLLLQLRLLAKPKLHFYLFYQGFCQSNIKQPALYMLAL